MPTCKDSMELVGDYDSEEVRAMLASILERMMAAVHYYVGTIKQVMGHGIMMLFGVPVAHKHRVLHVGDAAWGCVTRSSDASGHGAIRAP